MTKLDFKKDFKQLYNPSAKEIALVEVPRLNFLMIDGTGNPNTAPAYTQAVEALYSLSYALKFMLKKAPESLDYTVAPLEGLWWTDNMADFSVDNKDIWKWTMMIMQPESVTPQLFEQALEQTARKKDLPALNKVRLESFEEGLAAQIMHLGPYADEGPTIARLHAFIQENGYQLSGKHHEIYLSDPRRSAPEKMRTIIRQPAAK
jgi:hypothetical protein